MDNMDVVHGKYLTDSATRPVFQFDLRERIVRLQGDGFHRDVRVREFTDSQIELRMLQSFMAGVAVAVIPLVLVVCVLPK